MTVRLPILIIGSLPPFRSAAAALGLNTAEALSADHDVTFVVDDLAPAPPADLGFPVLRLRDLQTDWTRFKDHKRLFVPGTEGDSLFPLEMLHKAPGVVMPASLSLFPLAESVCRATGNWPGRYWDWLKGQTAEAASRLFAARVHHRRESAGQAEATPALDLLLAPATALVAASPASARMMKASGMVPDLTLDLTSVPKALKSGSNNTPVILYVSEEGAAAQSCRKALSCFDGFKAVSHHGVHPAARHLGAAVAEADIIVLLDGEGDAASPALAHAMSHQKPVITAGQPWSQHLKTGSHLTLSHSKAFDSLATSIAGLLHLEDLKDHMTGRQPTGEEMASLTESLVACLAASPPVAADLARPVEDASDTGKPGTAPEALPISIETAALIGAVPPPAILRNLLPKLDTDRCPRFSTPALAARLAALTGEHSASLLARTGYEAPVVQDAGPAVACHRSPVSFAALRSGLKSRHAISFACQVDGTASGDKLLEDARVAPTLPLRIAYDERDRNAPLQGFLGDCGLFWSFDPVRHALQCVLVVGHRHKTFRLKAAAPDMSFMVAGHHISMAIGGGTEAMLTSDGLGLLEFRLMALDSAIGTPLASNDLRKQLAQAGLILEWSAL